MNTPLSDIYKYILFDLDGTIIDNYNMMKDSLSATMVEFCYPAVTDKVFQTLLGMGEPQAVAKLGVPKDQLNEVIIYRREIMKKLTAGVVIFDGLLALFPRLVSHGCRLAIVTGSSRDWIRTIPAARLAASHFELVVTADDTEKLKPDPAPILFALDSLGADGSEAIYIGDGPHDIESSHHAGCASMLAAWNDHKIDYDFIYKPEYIAHSVIELERFLLGEAGS